MAYGSYYYITDWKNEPSQETPINRTNLLKIENGIKEADNRIVQIDAKKAELSLVNTLVKEIALDTDTGILTVTQQNGSVATYDLEIEKVVTNFDINDQNELVLTLADGTQKVIDLTRFVYSVDSTATVAMKILNRTITAEIVDGSVTMEKLDAAIQMEFRQYMLDTLAARDAALNSQKLSQRYAVGGVVPEDSEDNAKSYYQQTKDIKTQVDASAELVIPHFYIDFATGKLMSDTKAKGKRFWISNGILYGENVYGTMIRYSANADGSNMTESRQPTSQYVGVGVMPKEVYEHENLILNSSFKKVTNAAYGPVPSNFQMTGDGTLTGTIDGNIYSITKSSMASSRKVFSYSKGSNEQFNTGTILTFSLDVMIDSAFQDPSNNSSMVLREYKTGNSSYTETSIVDSTVPKGTWTRLTMTKTILQDKVDRGDIVGAIYFGIDSQGTISTRNWKLELGDTANPWTPAPSDWLSDPRNYTWTALNE